MFNNLELPEKPPTSAEEALTATRLLLQSAGISGATVSLEKPATINGGLAGAELKVYVPIPSLKEVLHQAALTAAAEQGVKVTQTHMELSQIGPQRLHLHLGVEAKVFGGSINVSVNGDLTPENGTHLRFNNLKMEGGTGMFGGIAAAMIRPKLATLEAAPLDFQKLASVPLELTQLNCEGDALTLAISFSAAN